MSYETVAFPGFRWLACPTPESARPDDPHPFRWVVYHELPNGRAVRSSGGADSLAEAERTARVMAEEPVPDFIVEENGA